VFKAPDDEADQDEPSVPLLSTQARLPDAELPGEGLDTTMRGTLLAGIANVCAYLRRKYVLTRSPDGKLHNGCWNSRVSFSWTHVEPT
jgi:hypothetical protein